MVVWTPKKTRPAQMHVPSTRLYKAISISALARRLFPTSVGVGHNAAKNILHGCLCYSAGASMDTLMNLQYQESN